MLVDLSICTEANTYVGRTRGDGANGRRTRLENEQTNEGPAASRPACCLLLDVWCHRPSCRRHRRDSRGPATDVPSPALAITAAFARADIRVGTAPGFSAAGPLAAVQRRSGELIESRAGNFDAAVFFSALVTTLLMTVPESFSFLHHLSPIKHVSFSLSSS